MLISATTGTVANPGSHILEYGAYRYLFDVQSASALTATLASTNLTLAANKLYPPLIGAGIGALADSGGMLSAADLRGPERRGLFFSPDLGRATTRHRQEPQAGPRQRRVRPPWRATAAGDYVVAPLVEAAHPLSRQLRRAACRPRGQGRVDNVGVGILARYWFLGGTYAEASLRSGRMRGSYTDDIDGSTNYRSRSNYWGPRHAGPCDAVERARPARRLCPPAVATAGGDSVRNDAGDQLSYDATQALRTRLARATSTRPATRRASTRARRWESRTDRGARAARWQGLAGRTPMAARRCWKRARAGAIAVLVAAPERARPVRGQAGNRGEAFVYRRF